MERITDKIEQLVSEMVGELKSKSKVLITDEEYDNGDDIIYETPKIGVIDKFGHYEDYAILELIEGGEIRCAGRYENYGDDELTFKITDLNINELIKLYDFL